MHTDVWRVVRTIAVMLAGEEYLTSRPPGYPLPEAILTAVLVFAVFGTAIDPRAPKIGGLAIGLAITADILMGGPVTGAAMNPARWFGPAVASGDFTNWYVWIIGPLIGGIVAAALYRGVLAEEASLRRTPASPDAA